MNQTVEKEVEKFIEKRGYNCSVEEFEDKVNWYRISDHRYFSEDFIREFKDKVDWNKISYYQKLSEEFIKEFEDKVYWIWISK